MSGAAVHTEIIRVIVPWGSRQSNYLCRLLCNELILPIIGAYPDHIFQYWGRSSVQCYPHIFTILPAAMTLFSSVLGFSLFGLGARVGQLAIMKRNIFDSAYYEPVPLSTC